MYLYPINEIAFNVYGFPIYWYGIVIAFSIFIGISLADHIYNQGFKYDRKEVIYEYAPVIVLWGLLFARLYYCLLNYEYYLSNPIEIINFRQGGLSIHGGIIGGFLSLVYISKRTHVKFARLLDACSCSALLAQSIGRWGNYFNSEAFGIPTNQYWGLFVPGAKRIATYSQYQYFHPTFLYESILDFVGFWVLLYYFYKYRSRAHNGMIFFLYLIIYSSIRLLIEPFRVDAVLKFGPFSIAFIVSFVMLIVGMVGLFKIRKKIEIIKGKK